MLNLAFNQYFMGHRIGIVGQPNSGKSYSRKSIKNGNEVFLIAPSRKMTYLYTQDDKGQKAPAKPVNFTIKDESGKALTDFAAYKQRGMTLGAIAKEILVSTPPRIEFTGNFIVVKSLSELALWSQLVNRYMPHIKTLLTPDFTHYVSNIISQKQFIERKAGGEAFQRFWELAGDTLNSYFTNVDDFREDLIVVTEFHSEYDEMAGFYKIFVPAGKMLSEKFLPDSYYDVLLYTNVLSAEEEPTREKRYKFITKKTDKFNARDAELFKEEQIPNNLQIVLDRYRAANGI